MSFLKPSDAPAQEGWKLSVEENIGSLFVFEPKGEKEVDTDHGLKTVVVADVTEIDLDDVSESETHEDVYVFPAWIKGDIRHAIAEGGMVLGRLAQDPDKGKGKNAAWVLTEPDEEDAEAAEAWLKQRNRSKLGLDSDSGEKKRKKKKS